MMNYIKAKIVFQKLAGNPLIYCVEEVSSSSGIPEWVNLSYDAIIEGYKSIVVSSWLCANKLNG
eukprot:5734065-Ditylum_brightwellii.AAC.1